MTRDTELLNLLLDRYERSGHCLPDKSSRRRVALDMAKGEYAAYRDNDPCIVEINRAAQALETEGLVTLGWRFGNWLLGKIYLNLDLLDQAYERAQRVPLAKMSATLLDIICQEATCLKTPWKLRFLEDEAHHLQKKLRPSRLLPENTKAVRGILKVLQYTENGPEQMRVISTNCFRDSKYLERSLQSSLISIAKAYEPELATYRVLGDKYLTRSVILEQIGILTYPEIFEFCGDVRLVFESATLDAGALRSGFCLQSENLQLLRQIDASNLETLLFVENRTNYRHVILQGVQKGTLVVFHGGFYSPAKRRLFSVLSNGVGASAKALFWGDIDLGGFLMFTRLKKDLFPNLVPWRMGAEELEKYKDRGISRVQDYLALLRAKLNENQIDPACRAAARNVLRTGITIEQEVML